MSDLYAEQWNQALDMFETIQWTAEGLPPAVYIHAQAGTGSRYEVISTTVSSHWRSVDSTTFVSVVNPWQRVWTTIPGSLAYPDYVAEHWGPPGRSRSDLHGGDMAAITVCVNLALGNDIPEVVEMARGWMR